MGRGQRALVPKAQRAWDSPGGPVGTGGGGGAEGAQWRQAPSRPSVRAGVDGAVVLVKEHLERQGSSECLGRKGILRGRRPIGTQVPSRFRRRAFQMGSDRPVRQLRGDFCWKSRSRPHPTTRASWLRAIHHHGEVIFICFFAHPLSVPGRVLLEQSPESDPSPHHRCCVSAS